MSKKRFESVWDAIEDTPQQAASMRARSHLMIELTELIRREGWTQKVAAERFGGTIWRNATAHLRFDARQG